MICVRSVLLCVFWAPVVFLCVRPLLFFIDSPLPCFSVQLPEMRDCVFEFRSAACLAPVSSPHLPLTCLMDIQCGYKCCSKDKQSTEAENWQFKLQVSRLTVSMTIRYMISREEKLCIIFTCTIPYDKLIKQKGLQLKPWCPILHLKPLTHCTLRVKYTKINNIVLRSQIYLAKIKMRRCRYHRTNWTQL